LNKQDLRREWADKAKRIAEEEPPETVHFFDYIWAALADSLSE
jgi:hypothetical protein